MFVSVPEERGEQEGRLGRLDVTKRSGKHANNIIAHSLMKQPVVL